MLTGLWNLRDIQNLHQNLSKNKLVRENAVTRAHESCPKRGDERPCHFYMGVVPGPEHERDFN